MHPLATPQTHRPCPAPPAPRGAYRQRPAYTLIEMLSVLVVISLLVSLVIGLYVNARDNAVRRQAQAGLGELHHALDLFYRTFGQYPDLAPTASQRDAADATRLLNPGPDDLAWLPESFRFAELLPPGFEALDPWHRPYQYRYDPKQPDTYDLYSFGIPGPETNLVRFVP